MSLLSLDSSPLAVMLAAVPQALPGSADADTLGGLIGRKALSLAEMLRHGLPVPTACALTTVAYARVLALPEVAEAVAAAAAAPAGDRAEASERVKAAMLTVALPSDIEGAIIEAYRRMTVNAPSTAVAVRSSGAAEDLEGASFAGMYDTYLNVVGEAEVVRAVRRCWASAWNERVASYAARKGLAQDDLRMAVVIQRLIDSEVAGVMFTVDPAGGLESRMRIEACFGLGEALVSGHVQPDCFVVDRFTGAALETTIAEKGVRFVRDPQGGVKEEPLSSEAATRATLGAEHLVALAELGRRVQAYNGCPQDLEWVIAEGKLWLVQSRPITTLSYTAIEGEWTTADFKDGGVSASVCSPYMWALYDSIWQHSMPTYLRKIKLLRHHDPVVWGRVFFGRPYWNCGAVKRCLHLVPGFNERNFDRDLGIEGAYAGDGVVIPVNLVSVVKALPVLFALEADYKHRIKDNQAFVAAYARRAAHYDADPADLPRDAQTARYRKLLKEDYFATETGYFYTIYNTSNAKLDFKVELDKLNKNLTEPLSYLHLLSGLQELRHMHPLRDLWALAGRVRDDAPLAELVSVTPAEALQDAILASPQSAFWAEVTDFLHRYRHHGVAELDITVPRWDEDPVFVLQTLKTYVTTYDPLRAPSEMNERQHQIYLAERARAEAAFKARGLGGLLARKSFFAKLDLVRSYSWWREELRDHSSRMYALIRRETLAIAKLLGREGALASSHDIWLLTFDEVLNLLEGRLAATDAQALVARRREDGDGYRRFTNPNELGRRFVMGAADAPKPEGALVGIPCSPGVITARVRVVPTIQDAYKLQAGEVLVTRFTDPGWTTLFSTIGAVATETGGILSHAAVIAREYGIPAVLAVPGATRHLKDGQWVIIDGHAGTILPIDPPDGPEVS